MHQRDQLQTQQPLISEIVAAASKNQSKRDPSAITLVEVEKLPRALYQEVAEEGKDRKIDRVREYIAKIQLSRTSDLIKDLLDCQTRRPDLAEARRFRKLGLLKLLTTVLLFRRKNSKLTFTNSSSNSNMLNSMTTQTWATIEPTKKWK